MELSHLPIIDWEVALKLAGNQKELAEEILSLLIKNLDKDISSIQMDYKDNNYQDLLGKVHKLHGALCYSGLARLKTLIAQLERDLKNNTMERLPALLEQLRKESNLVLKHSLPSH